jgi:hypothetical protein
LNFTFDVQRTPSLKYTLLPQCRQDTVLSSSYRSLLGF